MKKTIFLKSTIVGSVLFLLLGGNFGLPYAQHSGLKAMQISIGLNNTVYIIAKNSSGATGLYRWAGSNNQWMAHNLSGVGSPYWVTVADDGAPLILSNLNNMWWASSAADNSTWQLSWNPLCFPTGCVSEILWGGGFTAHYPGQTPVPSTLWWGVGGGAYSYSLCRYNAPTNSWIPFSAPAGSVNSGTLYSVDGYGNPWMISTGNCTTGLNGCQYFINRWNSNTNLWVQQKIPGQGMANDPNAGRQAPVVAASRAGYPWSQETWAYDGVFLFSWNGDGNDWGGGITPPRPCGAPVGGCLASDNMATPYMVAPTSTGGDGSVWQLNLSSMTWNEINVP